MANLTSMCSPPHPPKNTHIISGSGGRGMWVYKTNVGTKITSSMGYTECNWMQKIKS